MVAGGSDRLRIAAREAVVAGMSLMFHPLNAECAFELDETAALMVEQGASGLRSLRAAGGAHGGVHSLGETLCVLRAWPPHGSRGCR